MLSLDRERAAPGDALELTIKNDTPDQLEYGVAYRLERKTPDGWRWVNRNDAFVLILKMIGPGGREHEEIQLPGDLEPGTYRIVKSFTNPAENEEIDAKVTFAVT